MTSVFRSFVKHDWPRPSKSGAFIFVVQDQTVQNLPVAYSLYHAIWYRPQATQRTLPALRLYTNVSGETTQIPRQMTLDHYGLSRPPALTYGRQLHLSPFDTPARAALGLSLTLTTVVETYRRPKIINGEATTPSISESA